MRPLLIFVFAVAFLFPGISYACSCSGWYKDNFCENVDTNRHIVALVRVTDSVDYHLRNFEIIESLHGDFPVFDNTLLLGSDGANCGAELSYFQYGDSLIVALEYIGNFDDLENVYYLGGYCARYHVRLINDTVAIDGGIDYASFRVTSLKCFAQEPVSTDNQSLTAEELLIFPNPVTERFSVDFNGEILSIELIDTNARVVKSSSGISTLPVSDLAPGIYFARIATERGPVLKRFVKR